MKPLVSLTLITAMLGATGFGVFVGVCEANNPMPMPDLFDPAEEHYPYDYSGGNSGGFGTGWVWLLLLGAVIVFFLHRSNEKDKKRTFESAFEDDKYAGTVEGGDGYRYSFNKRQTDQQPVTNHKPGGSSQKVAMEKREVEERAKQEKEKQERAERDREREEREKKLRLEKETTRKQNETARKLKEKLEQAKRQKEDKREARREVSQKLLSNVAKFYGLKRKEKTHRQDAINISTAYQKYKSLIIAIVIFFVVLFLLTEVFFPASY